MNVRAGVGVFVPGPGGTFLFQRRARGCGIGRWSVPGGRIEFGETPEQTGIREVAEETSLVVSGLRLCAATAGVCCDGCSTHWVTVWMVAESYSGSLSVSSEADSFMWSDLHHLPDGLWHAPWDLLFKTEWWRSL